MTPKAIRGLAVTLRSVSYLLVFYAGLAIGVSNDQSKNWPPIAALISAILAGSAAGATSEIAAYKEYQRESDT